MAEQFGAEDYEALYEFWKDGGFMGDRRFMLHEKIGAAIRLAIAISREPDVESSARLMAAHVSVDWDSAKEIKDSFLDQACIAISAYRQALLDFPTTGDV